MRNYFLILLILLLVIVTVSGQSSTQIMRRCSGTGETKVAKASIEKSGIFVVNDCSGSSLGLNQGKFKLLDQSFVNFQNADCTFCLGKNDGDYSKVIGGGGSSYYAVDVEPIFSITNSASGIGVFSRVTGRVSSTTGSLYGGYFTAYSFGNKLNGYNGNLFMAGIRASSYVRSSNETAAYGGYFESGVGGNSGLTNTTPIVGVFSKADGGHNGTSPSVTGGQFIVTNVGGGGVGNITDAIGIKSTIDGSPSLTNFTTAKGISLEGWQAASGGTWTTSYGIYADASIDRGASRYFIYSLSTSPSLLTGDLTINNSKFYISTPQTPASASAACTTGQMAWDSGFVYVCVATNTWKRTALATW